MQTRIVAGAFAALSFLVHHACLAADPRPAPANDNPAAVQSAAAAPAARYVFHQGQILDYAVKVEQHTRLPSATAEPDFVLTSVATFDTAWTVRAVKANGDAEMEIAVKKFVFSADAPMLGKITADSDRAPDPAQQPAASIHHVLSAMQKGASLVSVTSGGKVASFRWQPEAAKAFADDGTGELKGFFGDLFSAAGAQRYLTSPIAILPPEPLKHGSEWKCAANVFGMECQDIYCIAPPRAGTADDGGLKFTIATRMSLPSDRHADLGVGTMNFDAAHNRLAAMERHYELPISGVAAGHTEITIAVAFKEPAMRPKPENPK